MSGLRARVFQHGLATALWRRLPEEAKVKLRPVLGLPEMVAAAEPAADPETAPQPVKPFQEVDTLEEMLERIEAVRSRAPGAPQDTYYDLTTLHLKPPPEALRMRELDPFSPEYSELAMELMDRLRGRGGYTPGHDELIHHTMQDRDLWSGLSPFDYRDPVLVAEFFDCYASMLRQIGAPPPASVLEYGPGTGQFLITLARLGYRCHAVDIEQEYLTLIQRQAETMGLSIACDRDVFGEGFGDERFDAIIFFEAFHHCPDMPGLLSRLRDRVAPGGRIILCGEPLIPDGMTDGPVPYAWGPRLDALSIESIRRGWMELGFQYSYLIEAFHRTGWAPSYFPHQTYRSHMIVASRHPDWTPP
ncbi:class I SAM-dependent methyltransferase [Roseococcus sp. YIM B11640]|uniref:class I SAM-dependent methyltransferase n=1 Tax=Roseococcus sp. YIM B11640 TaxID=3133973 RepID=UPI003C7A01DC